MKRVNINTIKDLKLPEIPKQKHLVYIFNKVSPEKIKLHGTSKQVYLDELLHRHPKSVIVFTKTTVSLGVKKDKLFFFICFVIVDFSKT